MTYANLSVKLIPTRISPVVKRIMKFQQQFVNSRKSYCYEEKKSGGNAKLYVGYSLVKQAE